MLNQAQSNILTSTPVLLLVVIAIGGIVAILSTWALLRQKVVVDSSGNVTEIEIPFIGKMKTSYPALGTAFLGVFMVTFAVTNIPDRPNSSPLVPMQLEVSIPDGEEFTMLFLGAIPSKQWVPVTRLPENGTISFEVPGNERYYGVAVLVKPGKQSSTPEMYFEQYQAEVRENGFYAKADFSTIHGAGND